MKILILGAKGMLAQDLALVFEEENPLLMDKDDLDITDEKQTKEIIFSLKPDLILNAAAYTNVDRAEDEKESAFKINGEAVGFLSQVAKEIGAILVHFSTDYVFDGNKEAGCPEDEKPKNPVNVYGASKLAGEKKILETKNLKYYLIRISWLFGPSGMKNQYKNFVNTISKLAEEKEELKVVNDQFGKPTYTLDVAKGVKFLISQQVPFGIYHLPNEGWTSWYNFAKKIIEIKGLKTRIIPCQSKEYKTKAKRPKYSILLNTKLPPQRTWEAALKDYFKTFKVSNFFNFLVYD